jgi:signal transduction histidine kinase
LTRSGRDLDRPDALLSALGHDLRSPLNVIIGFSDIMLLGLPGPLNEAQRHQVTEIRSAGEAMLRMTEGLVELVRIELGALPVEPETVQLGPFLEDIRTSFQAEADERGLTLTVETTGPDRCDADVRVLGRILGHLVRNALASTEAGGVTIRAEEDGDGRVHLEVVDTGSGISEHDRAMLFRPFDRAVSDRPRHGIGLGLFLSRRLADLVGAEISMETEVGRGSTFGVVLAEGH